MEKPLFGELEVLVEAPYFFEAPTYDSEYNLIYFTGYKDKKESVYFLSNGEMKLVPDTDGVGGTYIANDGYFYATNGAGHELLRYKRTVNGLAEKEVLYASEDLHQPNDLCVSKNGLIYFTDPDFKGKKTGGVYVWSKDFGCKKIIDHLPCPNGIILSKDEKMLIVSDSHLKEWFSISVDTRGNARDFKSFYKPTANNNNSPDGISRDSKGRFYLTGFGGVWRVDNRKNKIDFKGIKEFCSNVYVVERPFKCLILTCKGKVYRLPLLK